MDSIKSKRKTYKDYLWYVALGIFVVCIIEGFIYYHDTEDRVLRVLLNIQNAIKAYKIDPDIKLREAVAFLHESDSYFEKFIGSLYCLCIIVAPFCTVAGLTLLVRTYVGFRKGRSGRKGVESIIVMGEGTYKKNFIKAFSKSGDRYKVYTVEKAPLQGEEKVRLISSGIRIILDYEDGNTVKSARVRDINSILLCDEDPFNNLKLLNEITKAEGLKASQKIFFVCREDGISDIVKKWYDAQEMAERPVLTIYDPKKKAAEEVLMETPIADYVEAPYDVHVGILGFGEFGRSFFLSAANMAVMSADSKIVFDLYDSGMEKILPVFLSNFNSKILDKVEKKNGYYEVEIKAEDGDPFDTDGLFVMRFFTANAETLHFSALLEKNAEEMPYNYFVIALDTDAKAASVITEIGRITGINGKPAIVIRAKEHDILLDNVKSVREGVNIYSYEALMNTEIVDRAKDFHIKYSILAGENSEWDKAGFYNREGSIAQSMHQPVKEKLAKLSLTDEDKIKIEHRRWNIYTIMTGYANEKGLKKKDPARKVHDCILNFDRLKERRSDTLPYDYIPWKMISKE